MRHDNIEHRRQCVRADDGPAFYTVEAQPVQVAKPATPVDPWVKVGTTTIDGSLVDIANILDVSSWPIDWDRDAEASIDLFMRADEPWLIGGRHLRGRSSHVNASRGTALIRCDVVRRLSECCVCCDREHLTDAQREHAGECEACSASIAAAMSIPASVKPPCPECGPHGNRGEVLLASSWARCTTCAGGKPGDLWGEVKPNMTTEPVSAGATITNIPSITPLRKPPPLGFKVPTLIEMRGAALNNLRRHLEGNGGIVDDESIRRADFLVQMRLHGFGCGEFVTADIDERTS